MARYVGWQQLRATQHRSDGGIGRSSLRSPVECAYGDRKLPVELRDKDGAKLRLWLGDQYPAHGFAAQGTQ
jgi:hypothetical protein